MRKQRSLEISCYEDKIVQLALKKLMKAIYKRRFLDVMCHYCLNSYFLLDKHMSCSSVYHIM